MASSLATPCWAALPSRGRAERSDPCLAPQMGRLIGKARARERRRKAHRSGGSNKLSAPTRIPKIVRKHLSWSSLDRRHPLNAGALRERKDVMPMLKRLADDVETIALVSGAESLFSAIRRNSDHYDDFRYELRIAAAIQRSEGQEIERLAGTAAGPDIVFRARSGHRVGVACYRANSVTELVLHRRQLARRVADAAFPSFCRTPISISFAVVLSFEDRQVDLGTEAIACKLVERMLVDASVPGASLTEGSVTATRVQADLRLPNEARCVRLRILFNTRPFEAARVSRHIRQKVQKESDRWARTFDGAPLLAIEASDGAQEGALLPTVRELLEGATCPFWGSVVTWLPRSGVETVESFMVPERSKGLDIGLCTYGPNTKTWAAGKAMATFTPEHSWEDWDLVQTPTGVGSYLVQSLSTGTHSVRLPGPASLDEVSANALFQEKLAEAAIRIRDEASKFQRAQTRNVGRLPAY